MGKKASRAQAKKLAWLWSEHNGMRGEVYVSTGGGYVPPTIVSLVKRKWIEPNGKVGIWPNQEPYAVHVVTPAGEEALGDYLICAHLERKSRARQAGIEVREIGRSVSQGEG